MFKLEGNVDRYLFSWDDWIIKSSLDAVKVLMRSSGSGQSCPAHPNNFYTHSENPQINMWMVNKAGENEQEKNEAVIVFPRCSVHDAVHGQWLVEQAREGRIDKQKVATFLCRQEDDVLPKSKQKSVLLSLLDNNIQREVSTWNQNQTNEIAHLLSLECVQWIIQQACEGNWKKEDVGKIVCRENEEHKLVIAVLDEETQKQVALFSQEKTNEVAHLMNADFVLWLIDMAIEGKWSREEVGSVICRKNSDEQLILATLDEETQKRVSLFNQERTIEVAHLMSVEFIEWLIHEASAGRWSREEVHKIVYKDNRDDRLVLSTLNFETQKQVAVLYKEKTNKVAHLMGAEFVQWWLLEMANEDKWLKLFAELIVWMENADKQLVLATLDLETQIQTALVNQRKTIEVAHQMNLEFHQWLVQEAFEGRWKSEDVANFVFRNNTNNQVILSTLDERSQKRLAILYQEKTSEVAHLLSAEFVLWLIEMANEGKWSKEAVGSIVCRKNINDQLILATLDKKIQREVAVFNKTKTCTTLPYMEEGDFLQWLYQEAIEGRWNEQMVFGVLAKEEVDGKAFFVPRRKKGIVFVNIQHPF